MAVSFDINRTGGVHQVSGECQTVGSRYCLMMSLKWERVGWKIFAKGRCKYHVGKVGMLGRQQIMALGSKSFTSVMASHYVACLGIRHNPANKLLEDASQATVVWTRRKLVNKSLL